MAYRDPELARLNARKRQATYRKGAKYAAKRGLRLERAVRRTYGVPEGWYAKQFAAQGGLCAICGRPEGVVRGREPLRLSVDHDHKTGRVRGLLCYHCNTAIGKLDEDPDRLLKARDYILHHSQPLWLS